MPGARPPWVLGLRSRRPGLGGLDRAGRALAVAKGWTTCRRQRVPECWVGFSFWRVSPTSLVPTRPVALFFLGVEGVAGVAGEPQRRVEAPVLVLVLRAA